MLGMSKRHKGNEYRDSAESVEKGHLPSWLPNRKQRQLPDREVQMPDVTWDMCRVRTCRAVEWLADGYCVVHWDRGHGRW